MKYTCNHCELTQPLEFNDSAISSPCSRCGEDIYQYIDLVKPSPLLAMDLTVQGENLHWSGYRKPLTYIGLLLGVVAIACVGVLALGSDNETITMPIVQIEDGQEPSRPIISASAPEISQTSDSVLVSFELHSDSEAPYPAINILACLENPCNGKVAKTWTFASNAYPHTGEKLIKQTIQLQVPLRNIPSTTQSIAVEVVDSPANLKGQNH